MPAKILIIKGADFSEVAVEQVSPVAVIDFTNNLRYGCVSVGTDNTENAAATIQECGSGATSTLAKKFCRPAKDAEGHLFKFSDGEVKIFIPSGYYYRICLFAKDYNYSSSVNPDTASGANVTGYGIRTASTAAASNGTTLSSTTFLSRFSNLAQTYDYWCVNISKGSSAQATSSVNDYITAGVKVWQEEE